MRYLCELVYELCDCDRETRVTAGVWSVDWSLAVTGNVSARMCWSIEQWTVYIIATSYLEDSQLMRYSLQLSALDHAHSRKSTSLAESLATRS